MSETNLPISNLSGKRNFNKTRRPDRRPSVPLSRAFNSNTATALFLSHSTHDASHGAGVSLVIESELCMPRTAGTAITDKDRRIRQAFLDQLVDDTLKRFSRQAQTTLGRAIAALQETHHPDGSLKTPQNIAYEKSDLESKFGRVTTSFGWILMVKMQEAKKATRTDYPCIHPIPPDEWKSATQGDQAARIARRSVAQKPTSQLTSNRMSDETKETARPLLKGMSVYLRRKNGSLWPMAGDATCPSQPQSHDDQAEEDDESEKEDDKEIPAKLKVDNGDDPVTLTRHLGGQDEQGDVPDDVWDMLLHRHEGSYQDVQDIEWVGVGSERQSVEADNDQMMTEAGDDGGPVMATPDSSEEPIRIATGDGMDDLVLSQHGHFEPDDETFGMSEEAMEALREGQMYYGS